MRLLPFTLIRVPGKDAAQSFSLAMMGNFLVMKLVTGRQQGGMLHLKTCATLRVATAEYIECVAALWTRQ